MNRRMFSGLFATIVVSSTIALGQGGGNPNSLEAGAGAVVGQIQGSGITRTSAGMNPAAVTNLAVSVINSGCTDSKWPTLDSVSAYPTGVNNTSVNALVLGTVSGGAITWPVVSVSVSSTGDMKNLVASPGPVQPQLVGDPTTINPGVVQGLFSGQITNIAAGIYYAQFILSWQGGINCYASHTPLQFTVGTPPSVAPTVTAIKGSISWGPVTGAVAYRLKYLPSPHATPKTVMAPTTATKLDVSTVVMSAAAFGLTLLPNTSYNLVVSALNGAGEGPDSSRFSVVFPPPVPVAVGQQGAGGAPSGPKKGRAYHPSFVWHPSVGAESYVLKVAGYTQPPIPAATCKGACVYPVPQVTGMIQVLKARGATCSVAAVGHSGVQSAFSNPMPCGY